MLLDAGADVEIKDKVNDVVSCVLITSLALSMTLNSMINLI